MTADFLCDIVSRVV